MIIQDRRQYYKAKLQELEIGYDKLYRQDVQTYLEDNKLDKIVIRLSDGVEGVLQIDDVSYIRFGCINFYPITKKGTVSKRASGYVRDWEDITKYFKPKE